MRLFIHFDAQGKIVSASKVEVMHPGLEHPHGALNEGDDVLEVEPTVEQAALTAHELGQKYTVDVKKRKLQKRRK
jgi:hypothetical protein